MTGSEENVERFDDSQVIESRRLAIQGIPAACAGLPEEGQEPQTIEYLNKSRVKCIELLADL